MFFLTYTDPCAVHKHPLALSRTALCTIIIFIIKLKYLFTARSMHIHPHVNTTHSHRHSGTHTWTRVHACVGFCAMPCVLYARAGVKRMLCIMIMIWRIVCTRRMRRILLGWVWWHMLMPCVHACVASSMQLVYWHVYNICRVEHINNSDTVDSVHVCSSNLDVSLWHPRILTWAGYVCQLNCYMSI